MSKIFHFGKKSFAPKKERLAIKGKVKESEWNFLNEILSSQYSAHTQSYYVCSAQSNENVKFKLSDLFWMWKEPFCPLGTVSRVHVQHQKDRSRRAGFAWSQYIIYFKFCVRSINWIKIKCVRTYLKHGLIFDWQIRGETAKGFGHFVGWNGPLTFVWDHWDPPNLTVPGAFDVQTFPVSWCGPAPATIDLKIT